jgi:hypothetical protein
LLKNKDIKSDVIKYGLCCLQRHKLRFCFKLPKIGGQKPALSLPASRENATSVWGN